MSVAAVRSAAASSPAPTFNIDPGQTMGAPRHDDPQPRRTVYSSPRNPISRYDNRQRYKVTPVDTMSGWRLVEQIENLTRRTKEQKRRTLKDGVKTAEQARAVAQRDYAAAGG